MPFPRHPPTRRILRKSFRLTPAELALLERNARAAGLTLSEYVRRVAFGRRVRARRQHLEGQVVAQGSRLGNNLQQLHRVAVESSAAETAEIEATLEEFRAFFDLLLEHLCGSDPSKR